MGPGPDGPGKPGFERECSQAFEQLQWGRGRMAPENTAAGWTMHGGSCCFNGAGAGWPRKTEIGIVKRILNFLLQWGRGRMAPENWPIQMLMAPRVALLQWGRGRMAPENGGFRQDQADAQELQWGRGRMAPENPDCGADCAIIWGLQWGRGRMAPENASR